MSWPFAGAVGVGFSIGLLCFWLTARDAREAKAADQRVETIGPITVVRVPASFPVGSKRLCYVVSTAAPDIWCEP